MRTIYLHDHGEVSLTEALLILTDDYIEDGNMTHQTDIDLREVIKEFVNTNNKLKKLIKSYEKKNSNLLLEEDSSPDFAVDFIKHERKILSNIIDDLKELI